MCKLMPKNYTPFENTCDICGKRPKTNDNNKENERK